MSLSTINRFVPGCGEALGDDLLNVATVEFAGGRTVQCHTETELRRIVTSLWIVPLLNLNPRIDLESLLMFWDGEHDRIGAEPFGPPLVGKNAVVGYTRHG